MREICIFLRPMVVVNRVKPFEVQLYRTRQGSRGSGLTRHQHSIFEKEAVQSERYSENQKEGIKRTPGRRRIVQHIQI